MNKIEKIITELQNYVCGNICQYPCQIKDVEMLEEVCAECPFNEYVDGIRDLIKAGEQNE